MFTRKGYTPVNVEVMEIDFYGVMERPAKVLVNGKAVDELNIVYNSAKKVCTYYF